jgi:AcrR family transcriptional regulator
MPQYLKDEVQVAMARAAAEVFAARGYRGATMAEIARRAGVSTGNLYRYYESRDALFDDVVSERFVRTFRRLLRSRVEALRSSGPDTEAVYALASERLLDFCLENRLRVVILLGRAEGSRHAGFAEQTAGELIALALEHFRARDPGLRPSPALRVDLELIYRNFVASMVQALARSDDEKTIRAVVDGYARYHLAGLESLFASARAT